MHTFYKIKLFRTILYIAYPFALVLLYPIALFKSKKKGKYFFLFDRYELGGAQRVHIDILQSINEYDKQVYFTRYSSNALLKNEFYALDNTTCNDIHLWCDNLFLRIFSIHYLAFYINRHKGAQVFSSNSTFFYDMLPFLSKKMVRTELLHNFTYGKNGMEFFGLANHNYLDHRLCVDHYTAQNIREQYREYHIPGRYSERIKVIEPGVAIPTHIEKKVSPPLILFYAGRGGPQKRIYLLDRIITMCIQQELPVIFHFAGTCESELSDAVKQHSVLHGQIDKNKMDELYQLAHAIIMTSAFEGFPMLIKEGMAHGCIPIVTALEGNKTHLTDKKNGLLIHHVADEQLLTEEAITIIGLLLEHPDRVLQLSDSSYQYAATHFNRTVFTEKYRTFLMSAVFNAG